MNLFKDLVKRYGIGLVLGAATWDGYRRQVVNDKNNSILDKIRNERDELSKSHKEQYDKNFAEEFEKSKNQAAMSRYQESSDNHKKAVDEFNTNPNEYNKKEMDRYTKKLNESYDEIKKLDISEILSSLYNKYSEFLDSLTPDKIVCLFNIIIDGLILSSFISVLSIMLSENIINKIVFLEKYPRILTLLKLRNNMNMSHLLL